MAVRVVLQARLGSSRLPGKVLLPVSGMPLFVLSALRARTSGFPLVVATTVEREDDFVAEAAQDAGLRVVRGSRDDVLSRFLMATEDLDAKDVVVRLTADNVFPDGPLLQALVSRLEAGKSAYVGFPWPEAGVPYGLSAEAMRVEALRDAGVAATDPLDRQHVTRWLIRCRPIGVFDDHAALGLARLRCTVDTLEDYVRVRRCFEAVGDPVHAGWRELCHRLVALEDAPRILVPGRLAGRERHSEWVLGTAQLGMPYGRTNRSGVPSRPEAVEIIRRAVAHGIDVLDTARVYGSSEARIGEALSAGLASRVTVVTKLPPLDHSSEEAIDASVFRSCRELGRDRLDVLLLHRAADRLRDDGMVWRRLRHLRDEGVVRRLGVSAQTVAEARAALKDPDVGQLQIPFNLLDRRWLDPDFLAELAGRPDVVVHARSIFLQGLLAAGDPRLWPRVEGVDPDGVTRALDQLARDLGRDGAADLGIAYARAHPWLHGLVIGVETRGQLDANLALFARPPLSREQAAAVVTALPAVPETLVNPALWPPER